mgnify:CR=1 FL=1
METFAIVVSTAVLCISLWAFAGEDSACAIGCGTAAAQSTHATCTVTDGGAETFECSPDAGGTCNWNTNESVLVQCDQDVYLNHTAGGTATSLDFEWLFSADRDPVVLHLYKDDKAISCLAKSSHAKCKFGKSNRPSPCKNNP